MQIPIKRSIDRVPGGMMVAPLLAGALIATLLLGTPQFFGSFTSALFSGALTIFAVCHVCMDASIEFRATPYLLKKGGTLFAVKTAVAVVLGIVLGHLRGEAPVPSGVFAGVSMLAVMATLYDTNGGLDMALMGQVRAVARRRRLPDHVARVGPFLTTSAPTWTGSRRC